MLLKKFQLLVIWLLMSLSCEVKSQRRGRNGRMRRSGSSRSAACNGGGGRGGRSPVIIAPSGGQGKGDFNFDFDFSIGVLNRFDTRDRRV